MPHISREVFRMCLKEDTYLLQIPLASTYSCVEGMKGFSGKISTFVGMDDCAICMTLQDPGSITQAGHHLKDSIPIWTRNGKVLLNPESYMKAVETFKPDMYCVLSDGDTNISSPAKRLTKAVDRTLMFFRRCLELHKSSEVLRNSFVLAASAGGYSVQERERCINGMEGDFHAVGGFLIDGLHNNGPEVEFLEFDEIQPIIKFVIVSLACLLQPICLSQSIFITF